MRSAVQSRARAWWQVEWSRSRWSTGELVAVSEELLVDHAAQLIAHSFSVTNTGNRDQHGQSQIRAYEAACERGHDRARGPREDDVDGGDHGDPGEEGDGAVYGIRSDRQGSGGAGAWDHDRYGARGVRE